MADGYFNYNHYLASGFWERRTFLHRWWRFYQRDPHWVPPYHPAMRRALQGREPHLVRLNPHWLRLEALRRSRQVIRAAGRLPVTDGWTRPVAAAALLRDPRRRDHHHTFALLRCANDEETLNRLLEAAAIETGARAITSPIHLSPYLGAGALTSHWHLLPPIHTPYNPPYLPSLLEAVMERSKSATLFQIAVPAAQHLETIAGPAALETLEPVRLADGLLPLLAAACAPWGEFPPPDRTEAAFLIRWLAQWPLHGLLARVKDEPVGFVLLQPDLAPRLQRAEGGRKLLWRIRLQWTRNCRVAHGRILFGAVRPSWRGRGIGRQLMQAALAHARQHGWKILTVGPLPEDTPSTRFLEIWHASSLQKYSLYRWQPSSPAFFF